jgi:glycosyltransferase involved in cell wall biosynthesis
MKVLVINWRDIKNPEAGGAEIHIDEILKRKPSHWQVDFVSSRFKNSSPSERINGYNVIRIGNKFNFNTVFRRLWKRDFSRRGYSLVIDDISKIPLATPNYIKNVPILAIHHHVHGKSLFKEAFFPLAVYIYIIERVLLKTYRDIPLIAVSQSNIDELMELADFKQIILSHNGVDLKYPFERGNGAVSKTLTPTLVYLGRIKKYKRIDHLITAFKEVVTHIPEARFIIVGTGDDLPRLKRLVSAYGMEKFVEFKGYVDEYEKSRILASSWLFGITSEKEGWGIVVIEANFFGTPVIAYNVQGLRDSVGNDYNGILVEDGNISELSEAILTVFRDSNKRQKLSENAVNWASKFNWDNTSAEFYQVADNILSQWKEK